MKKSDQDTFFDIAIIGAGPSGMFVAHRLLNNDPKLRVAIIDKGKSVSERAEAHFMNQYPGWSSHNLISGAGGAGLYSDGKLVLNLKAGGKLGDLLSKSDTEQYVKYVENILVSYDGKSTVRGVNYVDHIDRMPFGCNIKYKQLPIRHFGSENLRKMLECFFRDLSGYVYTKMLFESNVINILRDNNSIKVLYVDKLGKKRFIQAKNVVFTVGKEGSPWLVNRLRNQGIMSTSNRTFFGVRIETNRTDNFNRFSVDPKFYWHFADGTKIKTHCYCEYGKVLLLKYFGLSLVGGHNPSTSGLSNYVQENSNFAVLLGDTLDSKFDLRWCMKYMKTVDKIAKGKLLVQRFGDFLENEPSSREKMKSNKIKPSLQSIYYGNIRDCDLPFDFYSKLKFFTEMLTNLDSNLITEDTLIYAPAIEWWMPKIETDENLQTSIPGIYVAGDGAGFSQGIMYAAVTGLKVADSLLESL